jgi:CRISPR-associated protein Csd1
MILQSLSRYYERKQASPDSGLAPAGMEWKELAFVLVLDDRGKLLRIEDTRRALKGKLRGASYLVPQGEKRASGIRANLLWDNVEYALGIAREGENPEIVARRHGAFVDRIAAINNGDQGVSAVVQFLGSLDAKALHASEQGVALTSAGNPNVGFRLVTDSPGTLVCSRAAVLSSKSESASSSPKHAICLVRAQPDEPARLHPAIRGVWGAQTAGANLISFNLAAFDSYGKSQGANAPVGHTAAFNYTTALNHLLRSDSANRIQIGDASTVFWASEDSPFEDSFASFFNDPPADDPDRNVRVVSGLYQSIANGVYLGGDKDAEFSVLALSPNAARLSVRFWIQGRVAELAPRLLQHFDDLRIVRPAFEPEFLPLWRLLRSTALLSKSENVPPNLAGDTIRSILEGLPYPATLLAAAIRRVRAERSIPYARAAVIKACLNRQLRSHPDSEVTVSLRADHPSTAYQLGRLFAALERVQSIAQPGINSTIRERYYGAASSTPASVFAILLRLKNHHIAKFESTGLKIWAERLLTEIFGRFDNFPRQLALHDQGLFAIGYYHQQQDFFAARPSAAPTSETHP